MLSICFNVELRFRNNCKWVDIGVCYRDINIDWGIVIDGVFLNGE